MPKQENPMLSRKIDDLGVGICSVPERFSQRPKPMLRAMMDVIEVLLAL